MITITMLILVAAGAAALTGVMKSYAVRRRLIDIPNARSSHTVPTPRGGGVSIVLMSSLAVLWLAVTGPLETFHAGVLVGGGALIALVGYVDDFGHVGPFYRLLVHVGAGFLVILLLPPLPPLSFLLFDLKGWPAIVLAIIWVAWVLNLYNFMDGIDGIAGVEAVTVSAGAAAILWYSGAEAMALMSVVLGAATLGFLIWNWPPAKIFMGDAGSGFIGYYLAALALAVHVDGTVTFWIWPILLGSFIVDSTFTLLRRLVRGEKIYEAHRSHAYQHAAIYYRSHMKVAVVTGLINILWLLPVAVLVAFAWMDGLVGLVIAYVPLLILAYAFRSGAQYDTPAADR